MSYRNVVMAVILCLAANTGCANTRVIINLTDHLQDYKCEFQGCEHPERDYVCYKKAHQTIDSVLKHYFTPRAYIAIKDIPLIDGPASGGYAAGVNGWANFASIISFNGYGRKVIFPSDSIKRHGVGGIIHEYVHHIDDMCRDGELKLLDLDEFKWAYILMAHDMKYAGIVGYAERRSNNILINLFGMGDMAEHIGYVAQYIITHDAPDYMKWVFRRVLNLKYETNFKVTTINGKILDVDLTTK